MTTLATDTFTGTALGLDSNWHAMASTFDRASDVAHPHADSATLADYTGATWPNDQWAQCTVTTAIATSDEGVGPAVRLNGAANGYFVQGNTTQTRLYRKVAGAYTKLGSDGVAIANGDVLYVEVQGTSFVVKKNGSTIITATDATYASGNAGLWGSKIASYFDNWSGGDFSGAPSIIVPIFAQNRRRR